jgi:protease II
MTIRNFQEKNNRKEERFVRDYLEIIEDKMTLREVIDDIVKTYNEKCTWNDGKYLEHITEENLEEEIKKQFGVTDLDYSLKFSKSVYEIPNFSFYLAVYQCKDYDFIFKIDQDQEELVNQLDDESERYSVLNLFCHDIKKNFTRNMFYIPSEY